MITTKRLKGVRTTGGLSETKSSLEVVYVYDDRKKDGGYQMRIDGRTSAMMAQATAEAQYFARLDEWLEMGAARLMSGMPLGIVDDACYTGDSNTDNHEAKETT